MPNPTTGRRSRYTKEEVEAIVASRAKHPEMTTKEWCKRYPIAYTKYFDLRGRLERGVYDKAKGGKARKGAAKAPVPKAPTPKAGKPVPVVTQGGAELLVAIKEAKRWRLEVERLSEGLGTKELRDLIEQLV